MLMNYLAMDTGADYLTVVVQKEGAVTIRNLPDCKLKHSTRLMGAVEDALAEANMRIADCDFFAAVTGPGSFTGIRIGISAAKGFALGEDKPVLGVTTFDCLAYNGTEKLLTVVNAGHGNYYVCGYLSDAEGKGIFMEPCFLDTPALLQAAKDLPVYTAEALPVAEYLSVRKADMTKGLIAAIEAKLRGDVPKSREIVALYVRKSQAEEGRKC